MPNRTPSARIYSILVALFALAILVFPVFVHAQWTDVTAGVLGNADNGAGVSWVDYDSDGDLDLYLVNFGTGNRLLRNDGGGVWFSASVGPLGDTGNGLAAVWADYDNDGDLDFYASKVGANQLLRNDGADIFVDVASGPTGDTGTGTGIGWADYDNDGDLDLYLGNYGGANKLFRNEGGSLFSDATSGPLGNTDDARGVAWGDYDNDGDLDLYLVNESTSNRLFRNDGGGTFTDVTGGPLGHSGASVGAAWGDYDNDGDLDLYLSNFGANVLARNDGGGTFTDVTSGPLGHTGSGTSTGWGDYDNDGDLDLYLAVSGGNKLLRNDGAGVFTDVTSAPVGDAGSATSFAWGDYDGDGDLDIYVSNNGANVLLRNDQSSGNHWLHVDAVGLAANPSGIGARVRVVAGGTNQIREISAGSGYLTQNSLTAEFGLGVASTVDTVEVYWSNGSVDVLTGIAADQAITVIEGEPLWTLAGGPALLASTVGLGVAWGDYDNDGDLDLYRTLAGEPNILYRNDAGVFTDATTAPLNDAGIASGAAWGDYDNDGDIDLYVVNNGANKLFRNDGAASFTDITSAPLGGFAPSLFVSWVDYDNDGLLDIFVGNHGANQLFRNLGGGAFQDITPPPLLDVAVTRGGAWADYDNDGDLDLYVANDFSQPNALYRNDLTGFTDVTTVLLAGSGQSWGVAWGDYDNDKDADLYIVNAFSANQLLRNDGVGGFTDVTSGPLGDTVRGRNATWIDYDNDGDLDLYVVNDGSANKLLRNDGGSAFTDVFGLPLADTGTGEGSGWGDYDNDGDLDVFVVNGGQDKLFRNDQTTGNYWLHVNLEGSVSNRSGIGARVSISAGGVPQFRDVTAGEGYVSQSSITAEFGLGTNSAVAVLEVRWPSGHVDQLTNVAANQVITVYEGSAWTDVTSGPLGGGITTEGTAWGDYDNDGNIDLIVGNRSGPSQLLRNNGAGNFSDATPPVIGIPGEPTAGVTWGDYDNDGDLDLYVANNGQFNRLLRNDGSGIFADATSGPLAGGISDINHMGAWGDYDKDGDLDLYVVNVGANQLFRNNGGGVFVDATSSPLDDAGSARSGVWGDYDDDGDLDLYIANISANKLLRNDGAGVFTDATSGPLGGTGNTAGAAWGDYDNDGDLDLYLTDVAAANQLLRNDGGGAFTDATTAPLGDTGSSRGLAWADYDNDGDLDLYVMNTGSDDRLFRNDGGGTFTDVAGPLMSNPGAGSSVVWGDYDNDGDLDLYRTFYAANRLYRNELSLGNHWLQIDLEGTISNRSAIGMRVRVVAGGMSQIREVSGGSGFQSQNSLTAEFGLGTAAFIDTVEVKWSSGIVDRLFGVAVDQRFTLTETPPWGVITSVSDVPADEGGWVDVQFNRSGFDHPEAGTASINVYNIHRRVDNPALASEILANGERVAPGTIVTTPKAGFVSARASNGGNAAAGGTAETASEDTPVWTIPAGDAQKVLRLEGRYYLMSGSSSAKGAAAHSAPPGLWEFVASVAALDNDTYSTTVPTPADSSGAGPAITAYFVAAHTATPSVFYDSPADSGYSLDNLAPAAPQNVTAAYNTGGGNQLSWDPAPEPDFQYYNIYRGPDPDFVHGPGNLVHSTTSTSWTDTSNDPTVSYKVTAFDHAGNESDAGSPGTVTEAGRSKTPARDALHQNIPNPFNPSTIIRYSLREGSDVILTVFDAAGRRVRTLVDTTKPAGVHEVTWNGLDQGGQRVASGVYFYRLKAGAFVQTRKMVVLK